MSGKKSRKERLLGNLSGSWGSSSSDFAYLAEKLYQSSKKEASDSKTKNWSLFVLAGIPMLLTSLKCLMVEFEKAYPVNRAALEDLAAMDDFSRMLKRYGVSGTLLEEALHLYEVRNEIMHPAHLPTGNPGNWPDYLRSLKEKGLLNTTGSADSDYILFSQMSSHRLFTWACRVVMDLAKAVVSSREKNKAHFERFLSNYDFYEGCDGSFRRSFQEYAFGPTSES